MNARDRRSPGIDEPKVKKKEEEKTIYELCLFVGLSELAECFRGLNKAHNRTLVFDSLFWKTKKKNNYLAIVQVLPVNDYNRLGNSF